MHQVGSRRAFLARLARYGYAAPVIATVLSREARAELSGFPTDAPGTEVPGKDDSWPAGLQSPTLPPGTTPSPAAPAASEHGRPWYWWFQQLFRW